MRLGGVNPKQRDLILENMDYVDAIMSSNGASWLKRVSTLGSARFVVDSKGHGGITRLKTFPAPREVHARLTFCRFMCYSETMSTDAGSLGFRRELLYIIARMLTMATCDNMLPNKISKS